jgi:hypothetical protein
MGVCEKVWAGYNGTLARVGVPWHFLLRDIMQVLHSAVQPHGQRQVD